MPGRRHEGQRARRRADTPLADVLAATISSLLTSMALEELEAVVDQGWQKVALGALLGLLLWWVLRWRAGTAPRVVEALRRRWLAALGLLSGSAAAVMVVTMILTGRPTTGTAVAALVALSALFATALSGRRVAGAAGGATAGGVLGLCLGILVSF